jgi:hypothetical protein
VDGVGRWGIGRAKWDQFKELSLIPLVVSARLLKNQESCVCVYNKHENLLMQKIT